VISRRKSRRCLRRAAEEMIRSAHGTLIKHFTGPANSPETSHRENAPPVIAAQDAVVYSRYHRAFVTKRWSQIEMIRPRISSDNSAAVPGHEFDVCSFIFHAGAQRDTRHSANRVSASGPPRLNAQSPHCCHNQSGRHHDFIVGDISGLSEFGTSP